MNAEGSTYFHEPAERGRLCVIRRTAPHYAGLGEVVARNLELDLAKRISRLLNNESELLRCAEILAALESDDGGRSFPTKQDCAFARQTLSKAVPS